MTEIIGMSAAIGAWLCLFIAVALDEIGLSGWLVAGMILVGMALAVYALYLVGAT